MLCGQNLLSGYKKGSGIVCSCCNREVNVSYIVVHVLFQLLTSMIMIYFTHFVYIKQWMNRLVLLSLKHMLVGHPDENREFLFTCPVNVGNSL